MAMRILESLDQNARLTAKELAVMLGEDEAKVAAEIRRLEEELVICGYPTLIDWDKTDKHQVTAMIEVKVTPQRGKGFDEIAERIYQFDEVEAVYLMSGGFDLTVMLRGSSLKSVAEFVSGKLAPMESVLSTATHFVLKKYKEHGIPLVTRQEDERMLITP
ncbi:MAG: Lrp/AsnC family transcriptional regulator [Lachnospiraceae bacterium]|nr:Lrp/AsnC family transcriptional regulator [Lachnospiraceae bacterium]MBR7000282.1 Lrp/AsnC family transcriptional regulator [Lachnospiraceae bacterium]